MLQIEVGNAGEGIKPRTEPERNGISIVATIKNDVWKLLPSGIALSFWYLVC